MAALTLLCKHCDFFPSLSFLLSSVELKLKFPCQFWKRTLRNHFPIARKIFCGKISSYEILAKKLGYSKFYFTWGNKLLVTFSNVKHKTETMNETQKFFEISKIFYKMLHRKKYHSISKISRTISLKGREERRGNVSG
jgi:hypothetical protein